MGEVITAKDKEYEAEERATAPGANQSMSDRVNNRSLRPQSAAQGVRSPAGPTMTRS